tara:strand:+ start:469 stop:651 length:183 start_codon:yes stop_codon:yes gene_type:complete
MEILIPIFILQLLSLALWLYAVISDAKKSKIAWLIVDIFISPIGVIRGLILFMNRNKKDI